MPIVSGPELDAVVEEARRWYNETRQWLIDRLTEDGAPYGSVGLSTTEQRSRYMSDPAGVTSAMEQRLMMLYKGYPDQRDRTARGMQKFLGQMQEAGRGLQPAAVPPGSSVMADVAPAISPLDRRGIF